MTFPFKLYVIIMRGVIGAEEYHTAYRNKARIQTLDSPPPLACTLPSRPPSVEPLLISSLY